MRSPKTSKYSHMFTDQKLQRTHIFKLILGRSQIVKDRKLQRAHTFRDHKLQISHISRDKMFRVSNIKI